jgi:hypothetical protein
LDSGHCDALLQERGHALRRVSLPPHPAEDLVLPFVRGAAAAFKRAVDQRLRGRHRHGRGVVREVAGELRAHQDRLDAAGGIRRGRCGVSGPVEGLAAAPGFDMMRRRRGREWIGQNDSLLRLTDRPEDRVYAAILTSLIGEGAYEVAAARTRRQAEKIIDAVTEYARRLMAGGPWHPGIEPPGIGTVAGAGLGLDGIH